MFGHSQSQIETRRMLVSKEMRDILIWATFALALSAHAFLMWDADHINDLRVRVAAMEELR